MRQVSFKNFLLARVAFSIAKFYIDCSLTDIIAESSRFVNIS